MEDELTRKKGYRSVLLTSLSPEAATVMAHDNRAGEK